MGKARCMKQLKNGKIDLHVKEGTEIIVHSRPYNAHAYQNVIRFILKKSRTCKGKTKLYL